MCAYDGNMKSQCECDRRTFIPPSEQSFRNQSCGLPIDRHISDDKIVVVARGGEGLGGTENSALPVGT